MTRRGILAGLAGMLATPAVAAPTRPFRLLVAGQSLAKAWTDDKVASAFRSAYGRPVEIIVAAEGGTSMLATRPRCWTVRGEPGPVLREALKAIDGRKFDALLWAQGQADADDYDAGNDERFVQFFQARTLMVTSLLRNGDLSVPVFVQTLGWTSRGLREPRGWPLVRHAQVDMVSRFGRTMNLRLGPVQEPWTPLADRVHPTPGGYRDIAARAAEVLEGVR